jgi:hypothetical protein
MISRTSFSSSPNLKSSLSSLKDPLSFSPVEYIGLGCPCASNYIGKTLRSFPDPELKNTSLIGRKITQKSPISLKALESTESLLPSPTNVVSEYC